MANPNPDEDTEFNDILRKHGIMPQKEVEVSEAEIAEMVEQVIQEREARKMDEKTLDELDELEDDLDEQVLEGYRRKRILEMQAQAQKDRFGDLTHISQIDFVGEVTKAGEGVWVVLHLYQDGNPGCKLLNNALTTLAKKFKATKFLKIIATDCIPNYPDKNVPTLLVYYEGNPKANLVGLASMGGLDVKADDVEWTLKNVGAVPSKMRDNPRKSNIRDVMTSSLNDEY